jgi:hypothetical protein
VQIATVFYQKLRNDERKYHTELVEVFRK